MPTTNMHPDSQPSLDDFRKRIETATGAERAWTYTSWSLLKEGYYTPDELIDLSLRHNFVLDSPTAKIKRGTEIGENVTIRNGTIIDGDNVRIGPSSLLDGAHIIGSDICFGQGNVIRGAITPDQLTIGNNNTITGISGANEGMVVLGNHNVVNHILIENPGRQSIMIGDHNELHAGLTLRCLFPQGRIRIGHYNSLGRDGGSVISTAYRYNKGWWGDILIGSQVETTRGAEVLGFALLGWPLSLEDEILAQRLFIDGPLDDLAAFFARLGDQEWEAQSGPTTVGLFGVVKLKKSCLTGTVKIRDDARIQSSFLKNVSIPERCKVYFTAMQHPADKLLRVDVQDRAIERLILTEAINWSELPTEAQTDGYADLEADFYSTTK